MLDLGNTICAIVSRSMTSEIGGVVLFWGVVFLLARLGLLAVIMHTIHF